MMPAPYARGQEPAAEQLLARTGAQLPAIQVSKAKVIANRTLRGNLAFLAEAPGRFRGTVDFAGNELVTLAFHEQGYALRYKMDAFPSGYYAGPPSACAVEALLGIRFETEGLVNLVLGGAPIIAAPFEIREQKWDKRGGYERLVLANASLVQELRFGWVANEWRVVGGQLWERDGEGTGRRLWTVEHIELVSEGGVYLPTKTKVSTPGKRRDDTVMINYKERETDPAFAKGRKPVGGDGPDSNPDPWEGGDPWEEEGDEWEDGAGEWEDGAAPAPADSKAPPASGDPATSPEDVTTGAEGQPPAKEPSQAPKAGDTAAPKAQLGTPAPVSGAAKSAPVSGAAAIPTVFRLEPSGLTVRGDLCR